MVVVTVVAVTAVTMVAVAVVVAVPVPEPVLMVLATVTATATVAVIDEADTMDVMSKMDEATGTTGTSGESANAIRAVLVPAAIRAPAGSPRSEPCSTDWREIRRPTPSRVVANEVVTGRYSITTSRSERAMICLLTPGSATRSPTNGSTDSASATVRVTKTPNDPEDETHRPNRGRVDIHRAHRRIGPHVSATPHRRDRRHRRREATPVLTTTA